MPKTYKTADKLKKEILRVSGQFFKEHGYDKTTYQMIADVLGISKSSIAYHFKTKPWIIYNLCINYVGKVYSSIKETVGVDFNYFEYHCAAQLFIYRSILKQKYNRDLFFHDEHIAIWEADKIDLVENYFKEIALDFKKEFSDEEIHAVALMNIGAKLILFKEFEQAPEGKDIDEQCKYLMYLVGMLSKLDEATVSRSIENVFNFVNLNDILPIEILE